MTIAIFGNAMKPQTLIEVRHILDFMTAKGVHVLLSQELRQELDLREYPGFPENWDGEQQPENVYGEPIDFALSVGGDGTFLTSAAAIGDKNIPILGVNCGHLGFLADVQTQDLDDIMQKLDEIEEYIDKKYYDDDEAEEEFYKAIEDNFRGKMEANHGFGLTWGVGVQIAKKVNIGYTLQYETAFESKNHFATFGYTF